MTEPTTKMKFNILFAVMRCHRITFSHDPARFGQLNCGGCDFVGTYVEWLKHIRRLPDVASLEAQSL